MYHIHYRKLSLVGSITQPAMANYHVYDATGFWLGTVTARTTAEATHKADARFGNDGWSSVACHINGNINPLTTSNHTSVVG